MLKQKEWRNRHPGYSAKSQAKYYAANKKKCIASNYRYAKKRMAIDPEYKLAVLLRQRVGAALKGQYKSGSAVKDLGCSTAEFKSHIENQFRDGMTWENHGKLWHLDHILPLANYLLTDRGTYRRLVHYTNYQPLLVSENLTKSNKED